MWPTFVVVLAVAVAAALWASPTYRGGDRPTGAVGAVLDVATWACLLGGIAALAVVGLWVARGRWGRAAVALLLVAGAVWALLVGFSSTGS